MISSFTELSTATQDMYCIVFKGTVDGVTSLCYLQRNNSPLFFYSQEQAEKYFKHNEIATCNDSFWFWKIGNLTFPDARIIKVTLSNFEEV